MIGVHSVRVSAIIVSFQDNQGTDMVVHNVSFKVLYVGLFLHLAVKSVP